MLWAAIIQLKRRGTLRENVETAISTASRLPKVDVVVTPENWLSRKPLEPGEAARAALKVAVELGVIVFSLQYIREEDGVVSRAYVAYPSGDVRVACEKLHPSASVGERGLVRPGRLYGPVDVRGYRVACVACVDIFYPEVARSLVVRGAEVIVNPSSIPGDRVGLWRCVLRARAAENTVHVIGVNSVGVRYPDGRVTEGGSLHVLPDGSEGVAVGSQEAAVPIYIDRDSIRQVRERRAFHEDLMSRYSRIYGEL